MAEQFESQGLVVLAIETSGEPQKDVKRFVHALNLKQQLLIDGQAVRQLYNIPGTPTTFWIDRTGLIVDEEVGFDNPKSLESKTAKLVNQPTT